MGRESITTSEMDFLFLSLFVLEIRSSTFIPKSLFPLLSLPGTGMEKLLSDSIFGFFFFFLAPSRKRLLLLAAAISLFFSFFPRTEREGKKVFFTKTKG